jgi:hypothetical protein
MSNKKRKLGLADLIIGLIYAPFMIVLIPWLLVVGILTALVEFLKKDD